MPHAPHSIIVRGEGVPIEAVVHTWHETGLRYELPNRGSTRVVVNHWTGSENPPEALFRNLKGRTKNGLSVHFAIDAAGEIWQFADTEARCQHAGLANGWSIGIEIINRASDKRVPTRNVVRVARREEIHGRSWFYAAFTVQQIHSAVVLNEALCTAYELPLAVPMLRGDVYPTVLPVQLLRSYRGVLGHLHLDIEKPDPGLELLREIQARGEARQLVT
jgi:N-acetyl-anhydromuramyl-L-alanine amidase AmpD